MTVREFLSTLPNYVEETDTDIPPRWWNWHHEWNLGRGEAARVRIIVGDQMVDMESEYGEPAQLKFGLDVEIGCETGQFDNHGLWVYGVFDWGYKRSYRDHDFQLCIGRWGIYVAVRGREIKS